MRKERLLRLGAPVAVCLIAGLLFYILNLYTPLFADDYSYSVSFADFTRIETVADILHSQIAHYQTTNGRFVTHTMAQFFLLWGKDVFNVINVFAFLLLGLLIGYHALGSWRAISATVLTVVYSLLFLVTPAFGQSYLWVDGAATYLYGVLLVLLYLMPYRHRLGKVCSGCTEKDHPLLGIAKFLGMLVLGIMAGNTVENMSAALIILIAGYLGWFIRYKRPIAPWMLNPGHIVGLAACLLSPGTDARLESAGGSVSLFGCIRTALFIGADFLEYFALLLLLLTVILAVARRNTSELKLPKILAGMEEMPCTLIYGFGTLAAAFSMILSPTFPTRAWSGVTALAIITLVTAWKALRHKLPEMKKAVMAAALLLAVLSAGNWFNAYFELKSTHYSHQQRVAAIQTAVEAGEEQVCIPAITSTSRYSVFSLTPDLDWDPTLWPNTAIARYYEIGQIVRAQEDLHN